MQLWVRLCTDCVDSGALLKYSFPLTDKIHLESVAGFSMFNAYGDGIKYNSGQQHKIYKRINTGIACSASLKNPNYLKENELTDILKILDACVFLPE